MILSASVNADVPAHYGEWFKRRLEAGYLRVAGADPWQQRRIELDRAQIEGIVFWTRDVAPFFAVLDDLRTRGIAFAVQYALTADRPAEKAIAAMRRLVADYGPRVVVWRYDPLVLDAQHDADAQLAALAQLAHALSGITDECVVAFARAQRAEAQSEANARSERAQPRRELVRRMAEVARDHGMRLTICADADALAPGASPARCIDARRLGSISGREIDAPTAGFIRDCLCARAVDIGDRGGSRPECFCGARPGRGRRPRKHDPGGEFLFPPQTTFKATRPAELPF
jgi:hypothetical protein